MEAFPLYVDLHMSIRKTKSKDNHVLRTVSDENAFYFYKEIGSPIDVKAVNLEDFLQKLALVDAVSIQFHAGRHDFENWIKMLGDATLAEQIVALTRKNLPSSKLQREVIKLVKQRLAKLRAA
ncbi:MAG: hypothetical protein ACRECH_06255 [Nitrososphaerales archaeon]